MKKIKIISVLALLFVLNVASMCSDDDDAPTNVNQTQVINTVVSGTWRITNYVDSGVNETANFTSTWMNDVLLGEKEWNKEMLGDFVKMMGTKNIVSGTTKVFEGLGEMLWGSFATGSGLLKVGSAQILAGMAMGGIGKAIGVTSNKKDDKSSATDKLNADKSKQKNEIGITTYLYPNSKSYYRQQLIDKRVIN